MCWLKVTCAFGICLLSFLQRKLYIWCLFCILTLKGTLKTKYLLRNSCKLFLTNGSLAFLMRNSSLSNNFFHQLFFQIYHNIQLKLDSLYFKTILKYGRIVEIVNLHCLTSILYLMSPIMCFSNLFSALNIRLPLLDLIPLLIIPISFLCPSSVL